MRAFTANATDWTAERFVMPLELFGLLRWLDGRPLLDTVEPYRRAIFGAAFSVDDAGAPRYSLVLCGRGKKNAKSLDLVLAGLYSLLARVGPQGAGGYLLANDEDQAGDDLDLCKKLVRANPVLDAELTIRAKAVERRDGRGELEVLPARDVAGSHGKTAAFLGFDEIHEYRDYSLLEALSPDPTRRDVLTWVCSYDSLWHTPGRPLWDLFQRGRRGDDPRMLFSWYSGTYTTDPDFASEDLAPERRANPSMGSWTNPHYLEEQRLRLPAFKFRRLHLNVGGQPEGAVLDAGKILACVSEGVRSRPRVEEVRYSAFVDMSGGSLDDACVAVAHAEGARVVLDLVMNQGPAPPFNPRDAVRRFAGILREYGLASVHGDAYAGQTFRRDFEAEGVAYHVSAKTTSELYEALEPRINAGAVDLLDEPKLLEQLQGLVMRGGKITHASGEHDDWSCAAAGAVLLAASRPAAEAVVIPLTVALPRTPWSIGESVRSRPPYSREARPWVAADGSLSWGEDDGDPA